MPRKNPLRQADLNNVGRICDLTGNGQCRADIGLFYFFGWWIFVGYMDKVRREEDPVFASLLFRDLLPVDQVLATRKWHAKDAEPWDCTYAIVRLEDDSPAEPPTRPWDTKLGRQFSFGGDWQETPAPLLGRNARESIQFCSKYWPSEQTKELQAALYSAGGWYSRDRVGEVLFLYAPKRKLAARIRFGD